ncbi:FAD-dependent oxidoreductase [Aurantiacibacter aquimixticola]|uniref:FAD-dependent monooxygenase n=1 Tax=Aurantiacibacter aquimixticola TaxID=1958945 RepID=A0A419RQC9_9SPHN|nr:NAD(P)/FAD-dependent oxidoreductase [Aurantiacibacter aquimixticola]RJY07984.1 FAD-dependent monooxygenase [Aurantiacibacter aquimixticola]
MRSLDIGIAGCGMAGLSAALLLHRQGHRITLYERFDEARPIGSGLMIQPTGMAVLSRLGLAQAVMAHGAQIDGLLGLNNEGETVLEAAYAHLGLLGAFGLGIHRASLFETLFGAVQEQDIVTRAGREVKGTSLAKGGRTLDFDDGGTSPPHELIVDALGVGSPLVPPTDAVLPFGALWATVDWPTGDVFDGRLLEQRYRRADRMVGLLPVGEGKAAFFWSLRGDEHADWQAEGMAAFRAEVCRLWPECEAIEPQLTESEQLTFARYAHRTSAAATGERIVHVGDSWHAASPQLGQGANMALLDAWGLAQAIRESDDLEAALRRYLALRASHVRLYQWLTRAFTPPFQSNSIWPAVFRDLFMAPASRIPPGPRLKAHLVAGLVGAQLDRMDLPLPDYETLGLVSGASPASTERASRTSSRAEALAQS